MSLGKVDKNFDAEIGERNVLFSPDGGTTWIEGKCDEDGRLIIKNADSSGMVINPATENKQDDIIGELKVMNSLVPDTYDYIDLSYTDGNLTQVTFKSGGSDGSVISILSLGYDDSDNLISVEKV
jgi:hypothetical protein